MPAYCCIPGCDGNKPHGPRVSVFRFPKKDTDLLVKWIEAISTKAVSLTESSKVCQRHFKAEDIITETSAYDSKRKVTITVPLKNFRLKPQAVPCIFEDIPPVKQQKNVKKTAKDTQEKDNTDSDVETSMQRKSTKSPSVSDINTPEKSGKQAEKKETPKSSKKSSPTTYTPIISVIKAEEKEDLTDEEKTSEKMEEEEDDDDEEDDNLIIEESKSSTLPSPFKNLPSVSVCLKEEDRIPGARELKGVKRSSSTGSNSSTGSSDVQKSLSVVKKRKIEKPAKPAPIVLGRQNDCYCWVCHRENVSLACIACPRAYHFKCANQTTPATSDWVCPECQRILAAENVDTRSSTLAEISLEKLGALLKLSLNKMKQRAPIAFHQPVSLEHYPKYLHYVIHPMDFSLLEKNIKQKTYGCTEAFLADVKWISHNSCVFNGTQHPLSTNAKNLVKSCDQDMHEIEICPDCFVHSVIRNKYWFSEVCRKPHPLVWAKLKGFPYWPAKVVRIVDGNVDARFFGAHDRAWVPVSQCYHLSKEMPTTSKPKKKGNYEVALDELNVHVHFLIQKFGQFEYAPYRTNFNPEDKLLMYHGIDIDKVSKEDITINSNPQQELNLVNHEKENRFASFMESEYEKSSAEEIKLNENQPETQSNHILNKIGIKSPSFIIKQRISTDSNFSEKGMSADESKSSSELKSVDETKSVTELSSENELKSTDESKSAEKPKEDTEMKKTESPLNVSEKESAKTSDSNQLRKLELALERIKGYVSLSVDSEKETNVQNEENENKDGNEKSVRNVSESENKDEVEKSKTLSPLFKKFKTLPTIDPCESQEQVEDVSVSLEATKKTDSFFLKLNETIESCKAKLGISEINDDLSSDESVIDDNASKSDEDEEDESSASEAEISEDDADEGESMEVSDEENENKTDDAESEDNESEEGQESESSDTDIESSTEASTKKIHKPILQDTDGKSVSKKAISQNVNDANEADIKDLINDSNEAIITDPDMQVPEVTIDASNSVDVGENSLSENSVDIKLHSKFSLSGQTDDSKSSKNLIASKEIMDISDAESNFSLENSKAEDSNIQNERLNKNIPSFDFSVNKNSLENITSDSIYRYIDKKSKNIQANVNAKQDDAILNEKAESSPLHKNEEEEVDDDIFICTPTRPKSPPVIILDDDQENETSSASNTFAIKSPPYSTSVDSYSSEENPNCKNNSDDKSDNNPENSVSINSKISSEEILSFDKENNPNMNGSFDSKNSGEIRKRKLNLDNSSDDNEDDDEIQIVTPVKKPALTGAIRTFNKVNNNVSTLKPTTPTVESVKRNLEKESLNLINMSPLSNQMSMSPISSPVTKSPISTQLNKSPTVSRENSEKEVDSPMEQFSKNQPPSIAERLLKSPIDTSNLSDKDKEIFYLKSKLNCVLTAYQIQSWKCSQEREELRHNMNLIVMEMRACLESDKKQAIEALSKKFEQEKQKCIEEAKRKQWCAYCLLESRYACCWNTSYCSVDCQKRHFNEHRHTCSQLKTKSEALELKQKSAAAGNNTSENSEKKKVYVLNMKSSDASQPVSVSKPQIQVVQPLQIASTNSTASNIQFVLAPVKSSVEPTIVTPNPSPKEPALDSAQIINQVRSRNCDLGTAITLLTKKNMETTISNLNKKEETKQKETNLEDIYFPSPPKITFEGYETATPDPNIILENEEVNDESYVDPDDIELPNDASIEPDVIFSDTDDKDNEMVNIGHGVEIKAKFLNKCLIYGQNAKKLTRCLVDVIFPDLKLLATCSAFGNKSNVTKLTRAALPSRKVHAIIDFVSKRYPDASRSEIVLQINMKCKEARVILNRRENEAPKKLMVRRLLAREKEGELATVNTSTVNPTVTFPAANSTSITNSALITTSSKVVPSVVCVKSTNPNMFSFNAPSKTPNILRCNSKILLRPKPLMNAGNPPVMDTVRKAAAILQAPPPKKRETVRNLLAANKMNLALANSSKDGKKLLMTIESPKPPTSNVHPASSSSSRPYIIIGSQINPLKSPSSTSVQHPVSKPN